MPKISTKKGLEKKWNSKIKAIKDIYDTVKKKNNDLPGFYNSPGYKDLKKRRQRALKRWDNRDVINERKRINNKIKSTDFEFNSDVSVYEAFSGVGRIFEDSLIQKHKDGFVFSGKISFKSKVVYFDNYSDFRIGVNNIIKQLYSIKDDSSELFTWRVYRQYSIIEKTILVVYTFYQINEIGDEIIEM